MALFGGRRPYSSSFPLRLPSSEPDVELSYAENDARVGASWRDPNGESRAGVNSCRGWLGGGDDSSAGMAMGCDVLAWALDWTVSGSVFLVDSNTGSGRGVLSARPGKQMSAAISYRPLQSRETSNLEGHAGWAPLN
jgi:hypothetical protein